MADTNTSTTTTEQQEVLGKIHVFESNASYEQNKSKINSNDFALVKDASPFGDSTYVADIVQGIDPDVLVANGTCICGTPLKDADGNYPFASINKVAYLQNKVLDLTKSWRDFKYLVFFITYDNDAFYTPQLITVPVAHILRQEKLYNTYITANSGTPYLKGAAFLLPITTGRYLLIQFYNTTRHSRLSNENTQIYIQWSGMLLYSVYGINSLEG